MKRRFVLAFAICLATSATAQAHSLVRVEGGQLRYLSADSTSHNNVTIRDTGSSYRITDPTVDGGMDSGPCTPTQVDSAGNFTEVDCSKSGITTLRVDIGEQDDTAKLELSLPTILLGGPGNDKLEATAANDIVNGEDGNDTIVAGAGNDTVTGGNGDDSIDGGAGDDVIHGGAGTDTLKAGDGNDDLRTRDGVADAIDCGAGADAVTADQTDAFPPAAGCEKVERAVGEAGQPEQTVVKADRVAPLVRLGGAVVQRLAAKRLVLLAAIGESGTVTISCTVLVGGKSFALPRRAIQVKTDGTGLTIAFAVPARVAQAVRSGLARGERRVAARFAVVARDRAGNASPRATRSVRLVH